MIQTSFNWKQTVNEISAIAYSCNDSVVHQEHILVKHRKWETKCRGLENKFKNYFITKVPATGLQDQRHQENKTTKLI